MAKQNINSSNDLKFRLDKTGQDAQQGIKWFLAAIDKGKANNDTLLDLSNQLIKRLAMLESNIEEFQVQLEKALLET